MGAVIEKTPLEILTEAAKALQEANRFRRAALIVSDELVVEFSERARERARHARYDVGGTGGQSSGALAPGCSLNACSAR